MGVKQRKKCQRCGQLIFNRYCHAIYCKKCAEIKKKESIRASKRRAYKRHKEKEICVEYFLPKLE